MTDIKSTVEATRPRSFPVIQGADLRSGTSIVAGFLPAGTMIPDRYEIPYFDARTKKGYQRQPQESRINALANDLRNSRVDLPTAVLLNIRSPEAKGAVRDGKLNLDSIHVSLRFFVVDGQHRVLALHKLITEDEERWCGFMFPFVCMLGGSEEEEMEQFYIVNSTAKSVRTDLALALLRRRADDDEMVYVALQERGRAWQVDGQRLVERLAVESPIWKHRIRLPGQEKADSTISSGSMVASLKPLMSSPYFRGLNQENQIKILEAYWHGIRETLRPVFDDPTDYTIQKGIGVIVLHHVLPDVIEIVRSKGWSVIEANSYAGLLKTVFEQLEGDNVEGHPIKGVEFWASAPRGAAGSYSSSAGRRVLAAKIRQLLPKVEPE
jgi:DGQHR domain-containing protein